MVSQLGMILTIEKNLPSISKLKARMFKGQILFAKKNIKQNSEGMVRVEEGACWHLLSHSVKMQNAFTLFLCELIYLFKFYI